MGKEQVFCVQASFQSTENFLSAFLIYGKFDLTELWKIPILPFTQAMSVASSGTM